MYMYIKSDTKRQKKCMLLIMVINLCFKLSKIIDINVYIYIYYMCVCRLKWKIRHTTLKNFQLYDDYSNLMKRVNLSKKLILNGIVVMRLR